jgi:hypothetical protein
METRPVAIVTGASSGIGAETAVALARRGYVVVLAARREDRLREVAARCQVGKAREEHAQGTPDKARGSPDKAQGTPSLGLPLVVPTDVTHPEEVERLVATTFERFGHIDVMVNNAGHGVFARVHETTDEQMRDIFEVNVMGVFHGCRCVAPIMMRQRSGHIFNVSSVLGKRGAPFHGAYSATKFAVCGLTEALRVEMMPYRVRVTLVCPALTDTEFFRHSRGGGHARSSFVRFKGLMPAERVAQRIAATVGHRRPEIVFTPGGRFLSIVATLWPSLADRMMRLYHDDLAKRPTD